MIKSVTLVKCEIQSQARTTNTFVMNGARKEDSADEHREQFVFSIIFTGAF